MSAATKIALIAAVVFFLPIIAITAAVGGVASAFLGDGTGGSADGCATIATTGPSLASYQPDQITNATSIVAIGTQMSVPEQGQVVAIAAALTESGLHNLDHGDRDSLGLFQQRPSQGWGTPALIMNISYAATQFYRHLLAVPGWQNMSVNAAAQAVQRSGRPDAYTPHEQAARGIVADVSGSTGSTCISGSAPGVALGSGDCDNIQARTVAAATAINYACGQRGLPYVWGGDGPKLTEPPNGHTQVTDGFDCSGLTKAAYAAAGIQIPRTAQTQYNAGPRVPPGHPVLPGDLVFFGTGPDAVTHVGIAISSEDMIDAPHQGAVVRIERIWRSSLVGATRPDVALVG
jgi:cell wall-associated NlpC family hydrolase